MAQSAARDEVMPGEKWQFDGEVSRVFGDMLERSIPQYEVMRKAVTDLAACYVKPRTDIVDLGCSHGEAMAALVDKFGAYNRFVGIEVSEPMIEAARQRFAGLTNVGIVDIRKFDLRTGYPPVQASVTLAVLTIQFVPIEYRQRIIRDVYKNTVPGGAFIFVEKTLGATAEIDHDLVRLYYGLKADNGYTTEQIERKRLSLEGVLVPVTAAWNEELLKMAGFRHVDCFWRYLNFAGWIALKE